MRFHLTHYLGWQTALLLSVFILAGCDATNGGDLPQLVVEDLQLGSGEEAAPGDSLEVHYVGTFRNGIIFDSSYAEFDEQLTVDTPFTFRLGSGDVIQGWDQGLVGMREGGKRRLTIPPRFAYGSQGAGCAPNSPPEDCIIPPNTTLLFDIELLRVN